MQKNEGPPPDLPGKRVGSGHAVETSYLAAPYAGQPPTFFVPFTPDRAQAELSYAWLANACGAPVPEVSQRVWQLLWLHHEELVEAEVGKPLPSLLEHGDSPVVAILDKGDLYAIFTADDALTLQPVFAGKGMFGQATATFFAG